MGSPSPDDAASADAFPEVERQRASDVVLRSLIDGIRGDAVPLGGRLPRAEELAARFGVSRLVVREALEQLRRAGVVEVRRGSGGGVFLRSLTFPPELLTERSQLDRGDVRELLEARRAVEMTCAALAAQRIGHEDLDDLRRLVDALHDSTESPQGFIELDVRFHLRLAVASGNGVLTASLGTVFRDMALVRGRSPIAYGSMQAAIALQDDLVSALASRDDARILGSMDEHLMALERHFLDTTLDYPRP